MELRRNHQTKGSTGGIFILRILFVLILFAGLLMYFRKNISRFSFSLNENTFTDSLEVNGDYRTFIPKGPGRLLHKLRFSLAWDSEKNQSLWVAYRLAKSNLKSRYIHHRIPFEKDVQLGDKSPDGSDYARSGYNRGHLVPAADMSWDSIAYLETFLMSNITPQIRGFNTGIWKEVEKLTRDWVYDHDSLLIISGPVFNPSVQNKIGSKMIHVPDYFFRIICKEGNEQGSCISFMIPNEISYKPLRKYLATIDDIERASGLDFFYYMWEDSYEVLTESKIDTTYFPFDEFKFRQRIEKWNYE